MVTVFLAGTAFGFFLRGETPDPPDTPALSETSSQSDVQPDTEITVAIESFPPPNAAPEAYQVTGTAQNFDPDSQYLLVFLQGVTGEYYVKPYKNSPLTPVADSGRFSANVFTNETDTEALGYSVLVVEQSALPDPEQADYHALKSLALAFDSVQRL